MAGVLAKPIELAVEAQARTDQERLWIVLEMLAAVDPSVGVAMDQQTGQTILQGRTNFISSSSLSGSRSSSALP
jgi:hypothetical protein